MNKNFIAPIVVCLLITGGLVGILHWQIKNRHTQTTPTYTQEQQTSVQNEKMVSTTVEKDDSKTVTDGREITNFKTPELKITATGLAYTPQVRVTKGEFKCSETGLFDKKTTDIETTKISINNRTYCREFYTDASMGGKEGANFKYTAAITNDSLLEIEFIFIHSASCSPDYGVSDVVACEKKLEELAKIDIRQKADQFVDSVVKSIPPQEL